ncbi:hypothetical protein [Aquibacillus salsiterrae]|uniref:Uncharacterized protein n=1 Tax=Aquibacillus salsiterrae TaxID=2950439 RepID=A0A9X4ADS2_9BACI|nr:hypothetical protein [Aquibacillus salsiterrae]MDC3415867.1 hypothetical protein [Aquibacillus salsiterrae]
MKLIGILIIVTLICWYEVPKMRKQKMKKELILFTFFLSISTGLAVLMVIGVPVPNPADMLIRLFSPIGLETGRLLR